MFNPISSASAILESLSSIYTTTLPNKFNTVLTLQPNFSLTNYNE